MKPIAMARAAAARIGALLACGWIAACVSVDVGSGGGPLQKQFVFDTPDAAQDSAAASSEARPVVMLQVLPGDPLADTTSIAYSKRSGERATYQLASWTEPPARRLAQVVQRRLESRGKVAVVLLGQPVDSRLLLVLSIESIVHDLSTTPDRARLAVRAELIDRRSRQRLALRTFSAEPTVANADSAAAVEAFGKALDQTLEQLAPWVETHAAAAAKAQVG